MAVLMDLYKVHLALHSWIYDLSRHPHVYLQPDVYQRRKLELLTRPTRTVFSFLKDSKMGKKNPIPVAGMPPTTPSLPKALLVGLFIVGTFAGRGESLTIEETDEWKACVRDTKRVHGVVFVAQGSDGVDPSRHWRLHELGKGVSSAVRVHVRCPRLPPPAYARTTLLLLPQNLQKPCLPSSCPL